MMRGEMLEALVAEMKRSYDSLARLRAQLTLTFAAGSPTRTRERGRTAAASRLPCSRGAAGCHAPQQCSPIFFSLNLAGCEGVGQGWRAARAYRGVCVPDSRA